MYSIMTSEENRDISHKTAYLSLIVIIILSAILRFYSLFENPPITFFEKLHSDAIHNLAQGRLIAGGGPWTFFTPHMFYPPVFYLVGSIIFYTMAKTVLIYRVIGAVAGIFMTFGIYLTGREIASRRTGLFSALLFAIYPVSIFYNRLILPQNLAALWLLYAFYFLMRARNTKNVKMLYVSAILIAIASLTVYSSILFVFLLYVMTILVDKERIKSLLTISIAPLILLFLVMLLMKPSQTFHDVVSALTGSVTESGVPIPAFAFFKGIYTFSFYDKYVILGLIGIYFYQSRYPWYLFYAILATTLTGFRGQGAYDSSLYPSMLFCLPFVILGTGRMTQVILDNVTSFINSILNFPTAANRQLFSPGKLTAIIGFYLVVISILYYVVLMISATAPLTTS